MIFKCKMCGGDMEYTQGASVMECPYCGTNQTLPKVDDERLGMMHSRANHLRLMKEFDKAQMIYEEIIAENPKDAEAHWCALLCRYGIEYVEDPYSHERKPTMHRTQFDAITEDAHYQAAVEHADSVARALYEKEAQLIDRIRKRYLSIASKEEPFDVFICYKETGADGQRTKDSVYAQEIYNELTHEGYKVFFARITLEDKLGEAYEPYIFAALGSAKVMLVVGTSAAHMQAEWVRNEWKRYLYLMKQDSKKKIIPVYRDMEAYDMPEEFVYMQAQDYGKVGALQDLVRGVEKIAGKKQETQAAAQPVQQVVQQTVVNSQGAGIDSLMRRAQLFLEDGDWKSADEYLNKVLDINPEYAPAYFGKVMAEYKVNREENFANSGNLLFEKFEYDANWGKAIRFAAPEQKNIYEGYLTQIKERREYDRQRRIFNDAAKMLKEASTAEACQSAEEKLKTIPDFEGVNEKIAECQEKAEAIRFAAYQKAVAQMDSAKFPKEFQETVVLFEALGEYRDCAQLAQQCRKQAIVALMKQAKTPAEYQNAAKLFDELGEYQDCAQLAQECRDAVYQKIVNRMNQAKTAQAYQVVAAQFDGIKEYRDCAQLAQQCREKAAECAAELQRINDEHNRQIAAKAKRRNAIIAIIVILVAAAVVIYKYILVPMGYYKEAETLLAEGRYEEASASFEKAGTYSDAAQRVSETYYVQAKHFEEQGEILYAVLMYRKSGETQGIQRANELMITGKIAAGTDHVVGVKSDGSVVAKGSNIQGECDIEGWYNIIAVSVEGLNAHTVGLKSDGTVVAAGNNPDGACNVNDWHDIVAVSVASDYTVGLKSDGTVVTAGGDQYGHFDNKINAWRDIVAVSTGAQHTVALKSDGTVVAAGSNDHGICEVGDWRDIVAVSVGANHTVALKADGTVVAAGDNRWGACAVSDWSDIVAVSAGPYSTVGLKSDGTIVTTNRNWDLGDWDLL